MTGFVIQPKQPPFQWRMLLAQVSTGVAGVAVYIGAHEAVHGALMWLFSRVRPSFGFRQLRAYTGSTAYFDRTAYLVIAAAPMTLWTIVLNVMVAEQPAMYFWPIWGVQTLNISSSVGDFYYFARVLLQPKDVLLQDDGTNITVYRAV